MAALLVSLGLLAITLCVCACVFGGFALVMWGILVSSTDSAERIVGGILLIVAGWLLGRFLQPKMEEFNGKPEKPAAPVKPPRGFRPGDKDEVVSSYAPERGNPAQWILRKTRDNVFYLQIGNRTFLITPSSEATMEYQQGERKKVKYRVRDGEKHNWAATAVASSVGAPAWGAWFAGEALRQPRYKTVKATEEVKPYRVRIQVSEVLPVGTNGKPRTLTLEHDGYEGFLSALSFGTELQEVTSRAE